MRASAKSAVAAGPQRGRRRRRGFSLLELVIAMAVLTFGMLAIAAAQLQAMNQGSRGRHLSAAAAVAQAQYERILRMPYSAAAMQPTGGYVAVPWIPANPPLAAGDVAEVVMQGDGATVNETVYNVTYRIQPDPSVPANPDLRLLDLRVTWTEPPAGPRTFDFSGLIVNNDY